MLESVESLYLIPDITACTRTENSSSESGSMLSEKVSHCYFGFGVRETDGRSGCQDSPPWKAVS